MPAFADTFPSNGHMLENKTYVNAATQQNIGVYDGTVTATAQYDDMYFYLRPGQYLPAGSEYVSVCPVGSYCPNETEVTYNETSAQGATSCPSGYPNSFRGSSSNTQCYTACTVGSANIAHATAVDGNDYYGAGVDTCIAIECENGYHLNESSGAIVQKTPLIDVDWTPGGGHGAVGLDGSKDDSALFGLTEPGTWAAKSVNDIVVFGESACVDTDMGAGVDELDSAMLGVLGFGNSPESIFGENGDEFVANSLLGKPRARFIMDVLFANRAEDYAFGFPPLFVAHDLNPSSVPAGGSCVCRIQQIKTADGNVQTVPGPWVYPGGMSYMSCESDCARVCASRFDNTDDALAFQTMIGALDFVVGGTCEGNEITINWTDATDEDIAANNAGMCTYGGDIRTPVKAMEKPGKKFKGWYIEVIPR